MKPQRRFVGAGCGLLLLSGAARAQGTFPARVWPAGPNGVNSLVAADFDRDGRPDLAATSPDQTMGVLRSAGRGLFEPFAAKSMPFGSRCACAADFNLDGVPDLVAGGTTGCSIALGMPDGSLGMPVTITQLAGARGMAAADFDLDGKLDLVLADELHRSLELLQGTGGVTFGPPRAVALPGNAMPYCVAVGDVSGDGILDLVAGYGASGAGGLAWMPGLGGFAFGAPQVIGATPGGVLGLELAQLDALPGLDVAAAASNQELVYFNAGSGAFGAPLVLNAFASSGSVDSGDFDGDGLADLAYVDLVGVELYRRLPVGGFAPSAKAQATFAGGGVIALDVDGDGALDVATASSGGILVFLGNGDGTLQAVEDLALPAEALATADMNGDGLADLVSVTYGGTDVEVRLGNGNGGFGAPTALAIGSRVRVLAVGKLDSDGDQDVAVLTDFPDKLHILLGDGQGGLAPASQVATAVDPGSLAIADLNNDARADVAVTSGVQALPSGMGVFVHFGNGNGGMTPGLSALTGTVPRDIKAVNLDGDGDVDLVCANPVGWNILRLINDGLGHFTVQTTAIGQTTQCIAASDLDGNGTVDLLAGGAPNLFVLRGTGGGAFTFPSSYPGAFPDRIALGDFDGNGTLDAAAIGGRLTLYSNDGSGGLANARSFAAIGLPHVALAAADFDGDGKLDLIDSHAGAVLYLNRGELIPPAAYCTAKLNSLGCTPAVGWTGASSASAASGFDVRAALVRNNQPGLMLYGVGGRSLVPISGGFLCLLGQVRRSPALASGGFGTGNNCSGVYTLDVNAFASGALGGNPLPALGATGTAVCVQFWGRDPGFLPPNATTMSDALEYVVGL